jgi:sulfite exporter TauE/SafE
MFLLAAISLGFLGSFHCIGMCGPIALTIPVKRSSSISIITGSLVYNSGRIITYACMGLLFGLLGKGFVLAGWQNILSVSLGIIILVLLFLPKLSWISKNTGLIFHLLEKLKSQLRKLFGIHTFRSLLLIGLLNGLLPCGLVYLGIAGSIATGDTLKGALFMTAFGLGTLPAMMAITIVRDRITISFREKIRKAIPVFVGLMAVLLILRGLNLDIPYVSPSIETNGGTCHHQCCHK